MPKVLPNLLMTVAASYFFIVFKSVTVFLHEIHAVHSLTTENIKFIVAPRRNFSPSRSCPASTAVKLRVHSAGIYIIFQHLSIWSCESAIIEQNGRVNRVVKFSLDAFIKTQY